MASKRQRRSQRSRGRLWSALTAGDRPFVLILAVLVVAAVTMALGPLQVFTEAAERVDELERQRDSLKEGVEELEERQRRLEDPDEVERLARSELGLVRPGELPIVVVVPEDEGGADESDDRDGDRDVPWHRRLGRWLGDRFAEDG